MNEWLLATIPSLFCGLMLWYLARRIDKRDKQDEVREKARIENNVLVLKGVSASLALGEATAEAIETQHCNGEMHEARVYARQTKRDIEHFMLRQGSERLQ